MASNLHKIIHQKAYFERGKFKRKHSWKALLEKQAIVVSLLRKKENKVMTINHGIAYLLVPPTYPTSLLTMNKNREQTKTKEWRQYHKKACNISRIFVAIKKRRRKSAIRCKAPARVKIAKCSTFIWSPTAAVCDFQLLTFLEWRLFVEASKNYHFESFPIALLQKTLEFLYWFIAIAVRGSIIVDIFWTVKVKI